MFTLPRPSFYLLALAAIGCQSAATDSDGVLCDAPELSSAFALGSELANGCDGEDCAASADLTVASQEEGSCALAGLKQGLRRGHKQDKTEQRQCQRNGKVVGQTAAALYCDLSIALGGLGEDELLTPGEQSKCSRAFESACHQAFDKSVRDYAASSGDPSADCTVFARGEFRRAFEIARFNQCLFSVGEPPPVNECADGSCECRDKPSCELDCQGEDCNVLCERANECHIEAGAGTTTCRDDARCVAVKQGQGTLRCERTGQCELTCQGPDCNIECSRVGICRARIDEGSVRCDHTGKCDVQCTNGKRTKRLRDGRIVCEGSAGDDCPKPRRH